MKNFKPGEQVVFSAKDLSLADMADFKRLLEIGYKLPQEMEVVTVLRECVTTKPGVFFIVDGYGYDACGGLHGISEIMLFPLEQISRAETDKILASIEKKRYRIFNLFNK